VTPWREYTWRCRRRFTFGFAVGRLLRGALRTRACDLLADAYNATVARRLAAWAADSVLARASDAGG